MKAIYYNEIQKVTNKWLWLLVATVSVVFMYGFIEQLILKHPFVFVYSSIIFYLIIINYQFQAENW